MADRSLQNLRILVVEDDYFLAQELDRVLSAEGATVVGPTAGVEDALALVDRAGALDAAVLDINLGGERSYPVAERLNGLRVPFLFCTGYNDSDVPSHWQHVPKVDKGAGDQLLTTTLKALLQAAA